MHGVLFVACIRILKRDLTPSTTRLIGISNNDGSMIFQDYGNRCYLWTIETAEIKDALSALRRAVLALAVTWWKEK